VPPASPSRRGPAPLTRQTKAILPGDQVAAVSREQSARTGSSNPAAPPAHSGSRVGPASLVLSEAPLYLTLRALLI